MNQKIINGDQLKIIQLEIMDYFDNWCRCHGITYYITAGTLIGALRHKGFIPWDDDIDVVMLRKEYERFIHEFPNSKTGKYLLYSHEINSSCIYPYAKVFDSSTTLIEGDVKHSPDIGVNIDIFPLDNATSNYYTALRMKRQIKPFNDILGIKLLDSADRGFRKNILIKILRTLSAPFSFHWLIRIINKKSKRYINDNTCRFIVNSVIYAKGEREILEREWFNKTIELEFEGRSYLAPIGADQYMTRLFGDYMSLPPEDKRVSHHRFVAYYK